MITNIHQHDDCHVDGQATFPERAVQMGHSQAQKADNRERILALAAAHIRAHGIDSLSVAPLMDAAGLTHGGFYGHFASRDALIAAAIVRALDARCNALWHGRQRQS